MILLFAEKVEPNVEGTKKKNIAIVMTMDETYFKAGIVALISLLENKKLKTFYKVNILVPDNFKTESETEISSVKKAYMNCKFDFIHMSDRHFGPRRRAPLPVYFRLRITSVLPGLKKCIFLDCDIMVRHDLSQMYDINMNRYYVAGVHDIESFHSKECKKLGIPDVSQYICVGVMLMNLAAIRDSGLEKKFMKMFKGKRDLIERYYADQSIINTVCYGRILRLPLEYGVLVNFPYYLPVNWIEKSDPTIVHFAAGPKPWSISHGVYDFTNNSHFPVHPRFHQEFQNYAQRKKNPLF